VELASPAVAVAEVRGVEQVEHLLRLPALHGQHGAPGEPGTEKLRDESFGYGLTAWRVRSAAHD
jgi:hypothetical protein